MKKLLTVFAGVTLALVATGAFAQSVDFSQTDVSGNASLSSRDNYRGQEYSTDPSLDLGLKVDNLGLKGLYVDGDFGKVGNTFPLAGDTSHTLVEDDLGVGYAFSPLKDVTVDLSAHHIFNAQEYLVTRDGKTVAGDYSEFRADVSYKIFFVEVGQGFGPETDTYTAVGVNVPVTDKLHVGADVSAFHYQNDGFTGSSTRYNNTDVFASYALLKYLDVDAKYSFGGKDQANAALSNYGIVGIDVKF